MQGFYDSGVALNSHDALSNCLTANVLDGDTLIICDCFQQFWRGGNNASVQFWKLPAIEAEVRKTARGMERMFSPFVSKVIFMLV